MLNNIIGVVSFGGEARLSNLEHLFFSTMKLGELWVLDTPPGSVEAVLVEECEKRGLRVSRVSLDQIIKADSLVLVRSVEGEDRAGKALLARKALQLGCYSMLARCTPFGNFVDFKSCQYTMPEIRVSSASGAHVYLEVTSVIIHGEVCLGAAWTIANDGVLKEYRACRADTDAVAFALDIVEYDVLEHVGAAAQITVHTSSQEVARLLPDLNVRVRLEPPVESLRAAALTAEEELCSWWISLKKSDHAGAKAFWEIWSQDYSFSQFNLKRIQSTK